MIEVLIGKIFSKEPGKLILICGGTGYALPISTHSYNKLKDVGEEQLIYCKLILASPPGGISVECYGFIDEKEREVFNLLNSVSGIGAKTTMQILSEIKYDRIYNAIVTADVTLLSTVKGISSAKAKKIIFELKGKFKDISGTAILSAGGKIIGSNTDSNGEAVMALVKLGYKNSEANSIVGKVIKEHGNDLSVQKIITLALKARVSKY